VRRSPVGRKKEKKGKKEKENRFGLIKQKNIKEPGEDDKGLHMNCAAGDNW